MNLLVKIIPQPNREVNTVLKDVRLKIFLDELRKIREESDGCISRKGAPTSEIWNTAVQLEDHFLVSSWDSVPFLWLITVFFFYSTTWIEKLSYLTSVAIRWPWFIGCCCRTDSCWSLPFGLPSLVWGGTKGGLFHHAERTPPWRPSVEILASPERHIGVGEVDVFVYFGIPQDMCIESNGSGLERCWCWSPRAKVRLKL